MKSLFGDEIPDTPARRRVDRAHPAPPGTGPEGMTCRECKHMRRVEWHDYAYHKCQLMEHVWSHGGATDIRCKDAACRMFELSKGEK